jgi:hypothetical protein
MSTNRRSGRPKSPARDGQIAYLSALMRQRGLPTNASLTRAMNEAGYPITGRAVDKWLAGGGITEENRRNLAAFFLVPFEEFEQELARRGALSVRETMENVENYDAHVKVNGRLWAHSPGGGEPTGGRGGTVGLSALGRVVPPERNRFVDWGPFVEYPVSARANAGEGGGFVATGERIDIPKAWVEGRRTIRVVEVVGTCMRGVLDEGDYAIIDADAVPIWTPRRPEDRSIVCVTVLATEEVLLKYLVGREEDGTVELAPRHEAPGVGERRRLADGEYRLEGVAFTKYSVLNRAKMPTAAQGAEPWPTSKIWGPAAFMCKPVPATVPPAFG